MRLCSSLESVAVEQNDARDFNFYVCISLLYGTSSGLLLLYAIIYHAHKMSVPLRSAEATC